MKYKRLLLLLFMLTLVFSACKKYDLSNVHGIHTEGEMLLPLASASYTIMDMMERFQLDSMITCDASGNMRYDYYYENKSAIKGSKLLTFKDMTVEEHFAVKNLSKTLDTTLTFQQAIVLQSGHVHVLNALMKSGTFSFQFSSDIADIKEVTIRCAELMDANGEIMAWTAASDANAIDLSGLYYETDEFNTFHFEYDVHVDLRGKSAREIGFDVYVNATDLALKNMWGQLDTYVTKNKIDTIFDLFPSNIFGNLEVKGVRISMDMKNSFGLQSQMVIDTALVSGPGIETFPVFSVMPQMVSIPFTPSFEEVYYETMDGLVCAHGGHAYATSEYVLNPDGMSELVVVDDTCTVGVRVNAEIPLAFRMDDVRYIDTVNMHLSSIESPEWIKMLTLELNIGSTIPLNMIGKFYMYDTDEECVTDTLVNGSTMIPGAFDGQETHASAVIEISDERLERVMRSERIILDFKLDTDANDVVLNMNQALEFYVKAKVEYDGIIEFKND